MMPSESTHKISVVDDEASARTMVVLSLRLSDRERQVFILVGQGYSSQQIASRILVGVQTVETYRARIAAKLGLRTRSAVACYAARMGLWTAESLEN